MSFSLTVLVLTLCLHQWSTTCSSQQIVDEENDNDNNFPFCKAVEEPTESNNWWLPSRYMANWPNRRVNRLIGSIGGVAVSPNTGDFYVFQRGPIKWTSGSFDEQNVYRYQKKAIKMPTILRFSHNVADNHPLAAMGENMFYMPHGITVDHSDNIWITDVALHQVVKLDKNGQVLLTLGEKFVPGNDDKHFCKPTTVAVAKNGEYFVADGYCNSRIMKFSADNKLLKSWGQAVKGQGEDLAPDSFLIPHSLALLDDRDEICVADRENSRVQCFSAGLNDASTTGQFRFGMDLPEMGKVYAISKHPKKNLLAVMGGIGNGVARSRVGVYDLQTKTSIGSFLPPGDMGFSEGHSITYCKNGIHLLIGSIHKVCDLETDTCENVPDGLCVGKRNLWMAM